ncbi:larval cuticle protein LCP-30-like isoform X2 [Hermetia illucens]|uniref:larval cuticle protein LCP-30-like isoform X2 n=1 Tax=Hermetia illucens TaxID=343691 RepID=UPI0018CC2C89|nr:larval cuticle protein LCP-30-like isoform X2 [Hermetia illucens]
MHLVKLGAVVVFSALFTVGILAQDDGSYRPSSTTRRPFYSFPVISTTRRPYEGRYIAGNDGRYRGGNDGRYRAGDGRYVPNPNEGRYVPSDEGKYSHRDVPYRPGGGEYTGGYKPDKDASYRTSTTFRPTPTTTSRSTASFRPYTYSTTQIAARPTVKGKGTGEGRGGWKIIRSEKEEAEDGYHYLFETENGILGEESGRVENVGKDEEGLKATGFYEYTGDDGNLYRVEYSADENGFNPKGDHIWPIPDSVRRTLEWLRANGELDR